MLSKKMTDRQNRWNRNLFLKHISKLHFQNSQKETYPPKYLLFALKRLKYLSKALWFGGGGAPLIGSSCPEASWSTKISIATKMFHADKQPRTLWNLSVELILKTDHLGSSVSVLSTFQPMPDSGSCRICGDFEQHQESGDKRGRVVNFWAIIQDQMKLNARTLRVPVLQLENKIVKSRADEDEPFYLNKHPSCIEFTYPAPGTHVLHRQQMCH